MTDRAFQARITVRLSPGVNDPQGNTVLTGLRALGYTSVRDVRVGKTIDLVVAAADLQDAQDTVDSMCRDLLANPVIETFECHVSEVRDG